MLAPPDDLPDAVLASALGRSWAMVVASTGGSPDTALVAPPERDLWHLDRGDPAGFDAYANATP